MVDGIPFASHWGYYSWNIETGLSDKIGSATISNIQFVEGFRNNFSIPKNFLKK